MGRLFPQLKLVTSKSQCNNIAEKQKSMKKDTGFQVHDVPQYKQGQSSKPFRGNIFLLTGRNHT
uniref:Uncharacterized protein n=2 Tax=Rhizophora mucronata TaxID=61149 RepID=A0A2P2LIM6_RHIMU